MKYSIIIPTRNKVEYLRYAVDSVLNQSYVDFELLVSNNHSTDGTAEYLEKINDLNLRVVMPPVPLSMSKHFEYAIQQARGEWISLIGDDDGLQPYFFQWVDFLILRYPDYDIFNSKRAYYFWQGSSQLYNNRAVTFEASPSVKRMKSARTMFRLLYTDLVYFDVPQFYTGTVFRKKYLEKVLEKQGGILYTSTIPDANSAAVILRTTSEYIFSELPFTWIGTSTKSNGYNQFNSPASNGKNPVVEDFNALNTKDQLAPSSSYDNFLSVPDMKCYFLEALFQSDAHYSFKYQSLLSNLLKRHLIFTSVSVLAKEKIKLDVRYKPLYSMIFKQLNINPFYISLLTWTFYPLVRLLNLVGKVVNSIKYIMAPVFSKKFIRIRSEDYTLYPTIREASLRSKKYFGEAEIQKQLN